MYATVRDRKTVVKILLKNGADINAKSISGQLHNIITIQYFYDMYIIFISLYYICLYFLL